MHFVRCSTFLQAVIPSPPCKVHEIVVEWSTTIRIEHHSRIFFFKRQQKMFSSSLAFLLANWQPTPPVQRSVDIGVKVIWEVLQNEFRYDLRKGPREIWAGTVYTASTWIIAFNTVITVPAEISQGRFRKSYRNSFCKTSLLWVFHSLDMMDGQCTLKRSDLTVPTTISAKMFSSNVFPETKEFAVHDALPSLFVVSEPVHVADAVTSTWISYIRP